VRESVRPNGQHLVSQRIMPILMPSSSRAALWACWSAHLASTWRELARAEGAPKTVSGGQFSRPRDC